jgi:hypothetical protein
VSGFWDRVTGVPAAPVAPAVYIQGPTYPGQNVGYPPMFSPQQFQAPRGLVQPVEAPEVEAAKRKAPSSRSTLTCPNCFGSNVCKPSSNMMEQCYDCGWNPRFEHSTAGAGMPTGGQTGPTHASRQVSTANNFNPQMIVAKVT